jgi:hypothetical protein
MGELQVSFRTKIFAVERKGEPMDDLISRHGTSAWLENMGHPNLAKMVMDEKRFPPAQPEIVRCEECKYHRKKNCPIEKYFSLNGFCSRGER